MNKPIEIDLYYQNIITGGGIKDIILILKDIKTNNISSIDNQYKFDIKSDSDGNNKTADELKYMAKGGLTLVIKIKQTNGAKNFDIKYDDKLILKISDEFSPDLKYIDKWEQDKQKYDNNLSDIYYYGTLFDNIKNNKKISYYIITREYLNSDDILKLSLQNQLKFIKSFFEFIIKLDQNKQYYRDCKFINMGYDIINDDNYNYIVLDHDKSTLKDLNDKNAEIFISKIFNRGVYGTFYPIYIHYYSKHNSDLKKDNYMLSKLFMKNMYSIGLIDMLYNLFNNLFDNKIKTNNFFLKKYNKDFVTTIINDNIDNIYNDFNKENKNIILESYQIYANITDNFDENNKNDIDLSNTIIHVLLNILKNYQNIEGTYLPNSDKIKEYIKIIDILLNKIKILCELVEQYKIQYPDLLSYKLTYPKSLNKFISK